MKNSRLRAIQRFAPLGVGFLGAVVSIIGAFTHTHWKIEKYFWGVEDQYYPEIFYIVVALPLSFLTLAIGVFIALDAGAPQGGSDEGRS